jgi:hypothetical protein
MVWPKKMQKAEKAGIGAGRACFESRLLATLLSMGGYALGGCWCWGGFGGWGHGEAQAETVMLERTVRPEFTPFHYRVAGVVRDEVGGPAHVNSRFPMDNDDPNPTSYFRGLSSFGVSFASDWHGNKGMTVLEYTRNFEKARPSREGRIEYYGGQELTITNYKVEGQTANVGWCFGTPYLEQPWFAGFFLVFDETKFAADVYETGSRTSNHYDNTLWSMSVKGKANWEFLRGSGFGLGPFLELGVPVYSKAADRNDIVNSSTDLSERIHLDHHAFAGVGVETAYRF